MAIATTRDETTTSVRTDFEAQAKKVVARHNEEVRKLEAQNAELTAKVEVHEDSWMTGGQQQQQQQHQQAALEEQLQQDREKIRVLEQNMAAKASEYMEALAAKEAEVSSPVAFILALSRQNQMDPSEYTLTPARLIPPPGPAGRDEQPGRAAGLGFEGARAPTSHEGGAHRAC